MPSYTPLTQAQLLQRIQGKLGRCNTLRPDLTWFWILSFNTGLRGAEIVNFPKLIIEDLGSEYLINTYKGSNPRIIAKTQLVDPLKTAAENRDYHWTLWSQQSVGEIYKSIDKFYDFWYVDTVEDRLTSRLLTHSGRIRIINSFNSLGRTDAFIANHMGINISTVQHYLSMQFVNLGSVG